jgi:phenylalanyl-tRNA synthetase beta chain
VTLAEKRICDKLGLLENSVNLVNPLSEDLAIVRPNLIVTGLPVIKRNHNYQQKDLFLFEIGNSYLPAKKGELPAQRTDLLLAISGNEEPVYWNNKPRPVDLYSLKGILEDLADYFKAGAVTFSPSTHFAFEKDLSFEVYFGKKNVGFAGKLSNEAMKIADLKSDVFIAELNFDTIVEIIPDELSFVELDRFPSADRDIAIVVDDSVKADEIKNEIIKIGKGLVREVWIFDLYKGKNIPKDKKSLAFGIKYRLADRTLKDNEVDEAHNKIAESLKNKFKAELRS